MKYKNKAKRYFLELLQEGKDYNQASDILKRNNIELSTMARQAVLFNFNNDWEAIQ